MKNHQNGILRWVPNKQRVAIGATFGVGHRSTVHRIAVGEIINEPVLQALLKAAEENRASHRAQKKRLKALSV